MSSRQRHFATLAIAVLLPSLLAIAGCGGSSGGPPTPIRPTPTATPTPSAAITGAVFGARPITGSTITLYQAGASGYGSGAVQIAQTTTGTNGAFAIPTVECQQRGVAQQIYLIATGGTISGQSGPNAAIALGASVGTCTQFANTVAINEATTVAMVWTLNQFMDATGQNVGTNATNLTGLANAQNVAISNFLDPETGFAPQAFPTGFTSPTETLYTFADILSSCVDSSGAGSTECSNLFAEATPPDSAIVPTTTLAAALNIARNPTNNVGELFALLPGSPPFKPILGDVPASWIAELVYAPASAQFNNPYSLALDSAGNVFVTNAAGNSIAELTAASAYTTALDFAPSGAKLDSPTTVAIDTQNNVWVTNVNNDSIGELTAASDYQTGLNFAPTAAMFSAPFFLSFDGPGNIWIANGTGNSVSELLAGCSSTSCTAVNFNNTNTGVPGAGFNDPLCVQPDSAGNAWIANYSGSSVTELPAGCSSSSCTAVNFNNSNTGSPGASFSSPIELAIDSLGNVWIANQTGNSVSELPAGCTSASCTGASFANPDAVFSQPSSIEIDSANNVWISNEAGNSISELTAASSYATAFNFGAFDQFRGVFFVAGDSGGNLWIANNNADSVSEVPGVLAPTLTPMQACLASGKDVCLP